MKGVWEGQLAAVYCGMRRAAGPRDSGRPEGDPSRTDTASVANGFTIRRSNLKSSEAALGWCGGFNPLWGRCFRRALTPSCCSTLNLHILSHLVTSHSRPQTQQTPQTHLHRTPQTHLHRTPQTHLHRTDEARPILQIQAHPARKQYLVLPSPSQSMPNPTLQHDLDNLPTSRSLGHYLGQLGEPLQLETVPTSRYNSRLYPPV
jgi:hypothetical protein